MMLEKDGEAEAAAVFAEQGLQPDVRFRTLDDYAIMSMVESGLGISILPEPILRRIPYHIVTRELEMPVYREIALALRGKKQASAALRRFLDYLPYR